MPKQSQIFNQFLGEISEITDSLHKICEKYSCEWEDSMPPDNIAEIILLNEKPKKN